MANKNQTRAHLMCSFIFIAFLLSWSGKLKSQNINRYYTSALQENGMLYFLKPVSTFKHKSSNSNLVFDISYLTSKDSVTLNFTLESSEAKRLMNFQIRNGNDSIVTTVKKLFVESKNKTWIHRYSTQIEYHKLKKFLSSSTAPWIAIIEEASLNETQLHVRSRNWKKQQSVYHKFFTLVDYN